MTVQEAITQIVEFFDLELTDYSEKRLTRILSSVEKVVHKRQVEQKLIYVSTQKSNEPVDLEAEAERVSKLYNVTVEQMKSKSRYHDCVGARSHLVRELKLNRNISFIKLGKFLNRDHTSMVHLCYSSKANCLMKPLYKPKTIKL